MDAQTTTNSSSTVAPALPADARIAGARCDDRASAAGPAAQGVHNLHVVMYHYVRQLPQTRFPRIKGMLLTAFAAQVEELARRYEMATLESSLEFLAGRYDPPRDLCLLTFDDGLKEHYAEVTPLLRKAGIQGLFFPVTGCLEDARVLSVHKNHFLMAELDFATYRDACLVRLKAAGVAGPAAADDDAARRSYRWDDMEAARLKFLLNFRLNRETRDRLMDELFVEFLGDEQEFSRELYLNWTEAREMQRDGMLLGGHSHQHLPLATLPVEQQREDLECSAGLLMGKLHPQPFWPFTYPYGKPIQSFDEHTISILQSLGFSCAFSTEPGSSKPGANCFQIRRVDAKEATV